MRCVQRSGTNTIETGVGLGLGLGLGLWLGLGLGLGLKLVTAEVSNWGSNIFSFQCVSVSLLCHTRVVPNIKCSRVIEIIYHVFGGVVFFYILIYNLEREGPSRTEGGGGG